MILLESILMHVFSKMDLKPYYYLHYSYTDEYYIKS
jgi:hypothetical protein